jgi:hypothetical protein
MSNRYKYEIDEANAIRVWDNEIPNELGAPFLFQPHHPTGRAWENKEDAESWVIGFLEDISKPRVDEVVDAEVVE